MKLHRKNLKLTANQIEITNFNFHSTNSLLTLFQQALFEIDQTLVLKIKEFDYYKNYATVSYNTVELLKICIFWKDDYKYYLNNYEITKKSTKKEIVETLTRFRSDVILNLEKMKEKLDFDEIELFQEKKGKKRIEKLNNIFEEIKNCCDKHNLRQFSFPKKNVLKYNDIQQLQEQKTAIEKKLNLTKKLFSALKIWKNLKEFEMINNYNSILIFDFEKNQIKYDKIKENLFSHLQEYREYLEKQKKLQQNEIDFLEEKI